MAAKFSLAVCVLVCCGSEVVCAPLCLVGDFDLQLQQILHAQMLAAQHPNISRALNDVRDTLKQRWQGYELTLYGSLAIGLGTMDSDIDLAVKLPNFNTSAALYVLEETVKLFNKQPELYSQVAYIYNVDLIPAYLECYHNPSTRNIEIEFRAGVIYIQDTEVVKYYLELDKRFLPLGVFLKYWFRIHGLTGHGDGYLPGQGLYILIIFYLQQKKMAPPGYMLRINSRPEYKENWNQVINELPYNTTNTENLHQLLGGFFKYYSEFNFEEYTVSPFTGHPTPRTVFTDFDNFAKKYTLYNKTLTHAMRKAMQKLFDTEVIIRDIIRDDFNTAFMITHKWALKFKYLMKSVAKMFEDLPSDRILRAILVTDEREEPLINHNNVTVNGINEQNCIEIADPHA